MTPQDVLSKFKAANLTICGDEATKIAEAINKIQELIKLEEDKVRLLKEMERGFLEQLLPWDLSPRENKFKRYKAPLKRFPEFTIPYSEDK